MRVAVLYMYIWGAVSVGVGMGMGVCMHAFTHQGISSLWLLSYQNAYPFSFSCMYVCMYTCVYVCMYIFKEQVENVLFTCYYQNGRQKNKSLMGFTVLSGEGPDIASNIHQYRQETRFLFIANKYLLGIWI